MTCNRLLPALVVLLALLGAARLEAQATSTAIVTGTERVFVRRGPGNEFPPFASIPSGSTVEIQEMRGEWARITTASGQVGYIHSNFLSLPGELRALRTPTRAAQVRPTWTFTTVQMLDQPTPAAAPAEAARPQTSPRLPTATRYVPPTRVPTQTRSPRPPTVTPPPSMTRPPTSTRPPSATPTDTKTQLPTRTPTVTRTPSPTRTGSATRSVAPLTATTTALAARTATAVQEAAQLHGVAERNRELEAELLALRQELAALKQRTVAVTEPANAAASCPEDLRRELARLSTAVEVLQRRNLDLTVENTPVAVPASSPADSHVLSPLAVLLGMAGIVVGAWLGSRYVRKQERSRRSRLRF